MHRPKHRDTAAKDLPFGRWVTLHRCGLYSCRTARTRRGLRLSSVNLSFFVNAYAIGGLALMRTSCILGPCFAKNSACCSPRRLPLVSILYGESSASDVRLVHPGRNVAPTVDHAPDIDVSWLLNVEHRMRVAGHRPGTQARKIEFVRVSRRARTRVAADERIGALQSIDETERCLLSALAEIASNDVVDVAVGLFTRNDRLGLHPPAPALVTLRTRSRNPSNKTRQSGPPGLRQRRQGENRAVGADTGPCGSTRARIHCWCRSHAADLFVDERLQGVGQGNVHRAHR